MNESSIIGAADLRVREALRFVTANVLQSVIASTLAAGVLIFLVRHSANPWSALPWLGALIGIGALRVYLRSRAIGPANADNQRRRLQQFMGCALASGVIWASTPWALHSNDQTLQLVLLLACVAIGAGGAFASLASLRTAFAIFWPPMLAPVVYGLLDGSDFYLAIGSVAMVLSLVLSRMLVVLNRQFVEQIDLRERNAELLLALQQRTADAEAANEAKSRFLVAASHDLRQPMHAIALRARVLLEQNLPEPAQSIAIKLDQSVVAMQSLFDALLDISKLEAGNIQPVIAPLPLRPLFEKLRDCYVDIAAEQAVDLHVDVTDAWVTSDGALLERILRQLLDNAMRHAKRSSAHLLAKSVGSEVVIEVRDTGKGIPEDQQRSIFKEFVQLENPERDRRKGLGLGLAIVERLAHQLGHRVELESEQGRGACFRIFVPSAQAPAPIAETITARTHAQPRSAAPTNDQQNLLIGLLDDDPDVLDAMHILLTRWRHDVVAATQSSELTEALSRQERPPDILICDYRLAEKRNGREVIDALRAHYGQSLPAILITGDIRTIERAGDNTDVQVLRKPVPPEVLSQVIATLSGRSSRRPAS